MSNSEESKQRERQVLQLESTHPVRVESNDTAAEPSVADSTTDKRIVDVLDRLNRRLVSLEAEYRDNRLETADVLNQAMAATRSSVDLLSGSALEMNATLKNIESRVAENAQRAARKGSSAKKNLVRYWLLRRAAFALGSIVLTLGIVDGIEDIFAADEKIFLGTGVALILGSATGQNRREAE